MSSPTGETRGAACRESESKSKGFVAERIKSIEDAQKVKRLTFSIEEHYLHTSGAKKAQRR